MADPARPSYLAGALYAAAGATCWSTGGALVRLTHDVDGWQIIFYRSVTVLLCMGLWFSLRFGRRLPGLIVHAGFNAVIAGIAVGTAGLAYVLALFYTSVAQAIFMVGLAPFFSALIGYWILRERPSSITWLAMTIALIGMGFILYGTSAGGQVFGTLLAIYSVLCFSCYAVLLRWGKKTEMSVALLWNAIYLIAMTAAVLSFATPLRPGAAIGLAAFNIGWINLGAIIIMGAAQLTLGLMLFTRGSLSVPAAQLSLIALIEPTLSPLWAWLVADELPPIWTFVGGAVIVSAIIIQALFSATQEARNARRRRS